MMIKGQCNIVTTSRLEDLCTVYIVVEFSYGGFGLSA